MINPFNFPFFVFTKPSLLSSFPGDLQSSKVGAETRWSDQRGNNVSSNQILDKTPVLEPPLAMSTMRESIDWLFALKMPLHFLCTYWTVCHQIEKILAHMSSKVLNIARGTTDQGIESITQIIPTAEACWIDIVDMVCSLLPLNHVFFYKTQEVVFLVFVSPYFL